MSAEAATLSSELSYRQLFRLPTFPKLAASSILARTAGQLWGVALILFALERYHSPALAGIATFLAIFPGLVLSPVAGALLDRYGRLRLVLSDYAIATVVPIVIALLSLMGKLPVSVFLVIIAISSLTAPLSISGMRALFPVVVPRPLWDRANAVDSASMALAGVLGPALAGFSVAWVGAEGAFLVTSGIFILAVVTVIGVKLPTLPHSTTAQPLWRAAGSAIAYVIRHPTLRGIILTLGLVNLPSGMLTVALPVLVLRQFHWGTDSVGILWSLAGGAAVLAGLVVGRVNSEGRERQIIAIGMAIGALAFVLILLQIPSAVVAGLFCWGLAAGPIDIGLFALRQRRTDPQWFGRILAVSMAFNFAGNPIGAALAGPLIEASLQLTFLLAAAIALVGVVVTFLAIPAKERPSKSP